MGFRRALVMVAAAVLFVGGLTVGGGAILVFGPNTSFSGPARSVVLPRDASLGAAVDSLRARGVLASATTFRLLASTTGWGRQLKAGHYRVEPGASNYRLLDRFRRGLQDPVRLTVPPGTRPETVAQVISRRLEAPPEALRSALRDTSLARDLGLPPADLFGYMLPETYEFYWPTAADRVVRRIVDDGFNRFYERHLAPGADSLGLRKHEVVTLASIVEWEALYDKEKPTIAGVYLNRLERGWRLQADPTVQYVLLDTKGARTTRVLYEHLDIEHPYNTYRNRGLPPGPITNPSPSSLRAVVRPEQHDYFYFAADGEGGHTFSRTLQEHNRAAEEYHRTLDDREADRPSR